MTDTTEDLFSEAIVVMESKQRDQNDIQQQQSLELENLKARVLILEDNNSVKRIRQMIDVATTVSLMRLEDKIQDGEVRLQELHKASYDHMNSTITKNGKKSREQRDEVKLLVTRLEKRVTELAKDSSKIQKASTAVQTAMDELELLETKIVDMINQPDTGTDSRIKQLEILSEGAESFLPRLEFFTYLDEFRMNRNEVVEKLVQDGIKEANRMAQWDQGYDTRNNNPVYRTLETAKRAARVRASSESADARIRLRSQEVGCL